MFFFPIGHEDSKIRRFPIVSVAIVVTCIMAFAFTWNTYRAEEKQIVEAVHALVGRTAAMINGATDGMSGFAEVMEVTTQAGDIRELLSGIEETASKYGRWPGAQEIQAEVARIRNLLETGVFHRHGLIPKAPKVLGFITHMFLHGGFMHLLFNMIFFFLVGPSLEDLWGRGVFAVIYLLSGLAAAVGYLVVSGPSPVPMIGASGAIAGLMGAFL
ncbi:MAG: rhomboid family intramembrane serine protease, partial [Planctomycetes bacterium]|nr:rhomboid family intramembrane serine protease [Planctomycetota bacterium]